MASFLGHPVFEMVWSKMLLSGHHFLIIGLLKTLIRQNLYCNCTSICAVARPTKALTFDVDWCLQSQEAAGVFAVLNDPAAAAGAPGVQSWRQPSVLDWCGPVHHERDDIPYQVLPWRRDTDPVLWRYLCRRRRTPRRSSSYTSVHIRDTHSPNGGCETNDQPFNEHTKTVEQQYGDLYMHWPLMRGLLHLIHRGPRGLVNFISFDVAQ